MGGMRALVGNVGSRTQLGKTYICKTSVGGTGEEKTTREHDHGGRELGKTRVALQHANTW